MPAAGPRVAGSAEAAGRGGGLVLLVLLLASTAFPVMASTPLRALAPSWLGAADVALALVVILAALALDIRRPVAAAWKPAAYDLCRLLSVLLLVLLVAGMTAPRLVDWGVLLPGLAWRGWLAVHIAPRLARAVLPRPV
jgi:hypothetical protein